MRQDKKNQTHYDVYLTKSAGQLSSEPLVKNQLMLSSKQNRYQFNHNLKKSRLKINGSLIYFVYCASWSVLVDKL